jgi:hypothetical protein
MSTTQDAFREHRTMARHHHTTTPEQASREAFYAGARATMTRMLEAAEADDPEQAMLALNDELLAFAKGAA